MEANILEMNDIEKSFSGVPGTKESDLRTAKRRGARSHGW